MLLFDAHLDLSLNAIEWNRDLTRPLDWIRSRECQLRDKPDRGRGTTCLPEMRRGGIGISVATQLARTEHDQYSPIFGWRSQAQAWAMTQAQLAWYDAMAEAGQMISIRNQPDLAIHIDRCKQTEFHGSPHDAIDVFPAELPIGFVLSLEGADSLPTLNHLERAWQRGLRAIGPAHYGPGVYANGTDATGGFPPRGRELLREIRRLGMILDVTHLCDDCFWEAMDLYDGPLWASHQNCRALVPHNRQFSDEQLREVIRRGGVIGTALDAWMMVPGWVRGQTTPQSAGLRLEKMADHIDHVCQLAGNANHSGIGSDLDGAFGTEQTPMDLQSIADLRQVPNLLRARGFSEADITRIAHGNFLRFLHNHLPA